MTFRDVTLNRFYNNSNNWSTIERGKSVKKIFKFVDIKI